MRLLALPVLFVAVGCGSDGTKHPILQDAKVFLDAGADAAPSCGVKPDIGGLQLGNATTPAGNAAPGADWFEVFDMGALAGKSYFDLGGRLPAALSGDTVDDLFVVDYIKPATGYALNTAVQLNPDPNAATPTAYGYYYSDVDSSGMYNKFYFASAGTITLTMVNETDGGITTGSAAGINFREVDFDTGMDVPGGCVTKISTLNFTLKQTEIADTPFQAGASPQLEQGRISTPIRRAMALHQAHLLEATE